MKPLRFCHLTTFYPPHHFGGDGIAVERLCAALARRGHEVTVVHDADAYLALAAGGREPAPAPAAPGVEVITLRSRLGVVSPLLTHQLGRPVVHGRRLARLFAERGFQVLNYHNASLIGGPGLLSLGRALKVYMAHEHWLVCPTHVLWRHGREPCPARECLRCVLRHRRPPQLWRSTGLLERRAREVDLFLALSEFSRAKHREFGFPYAMEVLPNFAPDVDGAPDDVGPPPHDRPYFFFAGRLERMKGLDDVVPLFRDGVGADLVVAGEGDHAARLRELAQASPQVRFLGRVPPADLGRWYRHALAALVPTVGFETFGMVAIEAFREGTPVLARRTGPLPEIVGAGRGELFSSAEELRAAVGRLVADPERRRELGARARQAFLEHWTEARVVPRYLELVAKAAERKGEEAIVEALEA